MDQIRRKFIQNSIFLWRIRASQVNFSRNFANLSFLRENPRFQVPSLQILPARNYAKDRGGNKKDRKNATKVKPNPDFLNTYVNYDQIVGAMQKSLDTMKDEFIRNLSLRSTTGAIEQLLVKVEGDEHELQEIAVIVRKDPKTIVVNMINFPQMIPDVLQALRKSGMNLNPQQDGTTLFIPVPKVTKEHRESLAKNAKALFIKCRDAIKEIQNNAVKKLKKKEKVPIDEMHMCIAQLETVRDNFIAEAEKLLETKRVELIGTEK
ncbi:ribosome-recycling factor, mitochondrial [Culicoides brevitarsis]|uniref:ribosome-recycling factor, mitochondrial n=1 Tax=Culicoides brevitarsis TaxID=469753 RepID=UPI00307C49CB